MLKCGPVVDVLVSGGVVAGGDEWGVAELGRGCFDAVDVADVGGDAVADLGGCDGGEAPSFPGA